MEEDLFTLRRSLAEAVLEGCEGLPIDEAVEKFLESQKLVFVIEQNRDAQMRSLLTLETRVPKEKLRSLLHYSGLPISSEFIVKGVLAEVEPKSRKPQAVPSENLVAGGAA